METESAEWLPITSETLRVRRPRILIVEDDLTLEPLWSYVLETVAPEAIVRWVRSEEAAEHMIEHQGRESEKFSLIIADVFLSGSRTGLDLWRRHGKGKATFLLMSAVSPQKFAELVGETISPPSYLQKPLDPGMCIDALKAALA